MDLVGACRAFVSVSERGSFTVGAAVARVSQPVASRRVAALEEHFGEQLFERTSRQAVLTPFGRDMLPAARQLVQAADALEHGAGVAKRRPWWLAVPGTCSTAGLARLVADARGRGVTLEVRAAEPARRAELLHAQQVRAALLAVPEDVAAWSVPLGLACAQNPDVNRIYVETLRLGRAPDGPARRIWIQPEDDVPHVRDPLTRLRDATGLQPAQLAVATGLTAAVAEVLCSRDLLLCSPGQAEELDLYWRPLGELTLSRGYALAAAAAGNPRHFRARLGDALARCLDADAPEETGPSARVGEGTM